MTPQDGEQGQNSLTVSKSLALARQQPEIPYEVSATLEAALKEVTRRIEMQPDTYVMSKEEYTVLTYFQDRWKDNGLFEHAIAIFWRSRHGNSIFPSSPSVLRRSATKDVLDIPPPGYLGPDSASDVFQSSLREFCNSQGIDPPKYRVMSDRRGGRTAWSCSVTVGDQVFSARYWYDDDNTTKAVEDSAEEALRRLRRRSTESALRKQTLQTSKKIWSMQHPLEVSGQLKSPRGTVDADGTGSEPFTTVKDILGSESLGHKQTFFDPTTGGTHTLTPKTSLCSESGSIEVEDMHSSNEIETGESAGGKQKSQEALPENLFPETAEYETTSPMHNVQLRNMSTDVFNNANAKLLDRFLFRMLDGKGEIQGGRTLEKEFWMSGRRVKTYSWRTYLVIIVHPLVDPQTLFSDMSSLFFKVLAEHLFAIIDSLTGMHLNRVFRQSGLANTMKLSIEESTGVSWDWWPFLPSRQPFQESEFLMEWYCDAGHQHSTYIPREYVDILERNIKERWSNEGSLMFSGRPGHLSSGSVICAGNTCSSDSGNDHGAGSSTYSSSYTTSENSSQSQTNPTSRQVRRERLKEAEQPDAGMTVEISGSNCMKGFVLFAVQGAKRMQGVRTRLAQIDLELHNDDDHFFDEIKIQYHNLRGFFRRAFSIWTFMTCDFVEFRKENPEEIYVGPNGMPPSDDKDYQYEPDQEPPVLPRVFNNHFYGCKKGCIRAQLDILRLFHACQGRNHCGRFKILNRLPKRCAKWNPQQDQEKDKAWGLYAVLGISFLRVLLYHAAVLMGPTVFWGLWLRKWPRDWQNASIPFLGVGMLLSLFWLLLTQTSGLEHTVKREKIL